MDDPQQIRPHGRAEGRDVGSFLGPIDKGRDWESNEELLSRFYVVPKKKTFGAGVVIDELHSEDLGEEDPSNEFDDVELFLAEGDDEGTPEMNQDPFEESEVKEILATTWQEKRRSLQPTAEVPKIS